MIEMCLRERPRVRAIGVRPRDGQAFVCGCLMEKPALSLSRPGARCRDYSRSVSLNLSPNPPCPITEQRALQGLCRQAVSKTHGLGTLSPR